MIAHNGVIQENRPMFLSKPLHQVESVRFESDYLLMTIDGREYAFPLTGFAQSLRDASERDREYFQVSASGYGIHWPTLDLDLSIDGLIASLSSVSEAA